MDTIFFLVFIGRNYFWFVSPSAFIVYSYASAHVVFVFVFSAVFVLIISVCIFALRVGIFAFVGADRYSIIFFNIIISVRYACCTY